MKYSDAQMRAHFFLNSRRYDEAEMQLKQALIADPNDADSLNLLAYCCLMQHKSKEALQHIDNAIALDPANGRHFYIRSYIKYDDSDYKTAESNILEAISLSALEPEYFSLLANIQIHTAHFKEALEAANNGLAIDAENLSCLNARSIALLKLKKADAAYATIEKALNYDPMDSQTHTTFGYALLENGESKISLVHFREALRLNPSNEAARRGIIEAMKSRYLVYRLFLQYSFWLSRLKGNAQWAFIIGLYFLIRIIDSVASNNPSLAPFLSPIIYIYGAFVVFTWLIMPISNLFLQMNKFGRYALNKTEKQYSILIGILLGVGILSILGLLFLKYGFFFEMTVISISMCLPLSAMQHIVRKNQKQIMRILVTVMAAFGVGMILLSFLGKEDGPLFMFYIILTLGSQILANYYLSKR
jgi:tetratricopeptide (TPR) repeat protein